MKTFKFKCDEYKRCPCCESSFDCCMATKEKIIGNCVGDLNDRPEFCPLEEIKFYDPESNKVKIKTTFEKAFKKYLAEKNNR